MARRRNTFPGLPETAIRELVGLQDELIADSKQLRTETVGITTDTKTSGVYGCRFYEKVRCQPGSAGLDLTFPKPDPTTQNRWIAVELLNTNNVRIKADKGLVNGQAQATLNAVGVYWFESDAIQGWLCPPVSSGGSGAPVGAEYVLTSADGTLTNEHVATTTAEILVSVAVGTITWALQNASVALARLATQAANTILANATAGVASPTAVAVGANTVVGRVAGNIVAAALVDAQVDAAAGIQLSKLQGQAANVAIVNNTAGVAAPAAMAVGTESVVGRAAGNITALASAVQSALFRGSGSLAFGAAAAGQHLRRSIAGGDLGFSALEIGGLGVPLAVNAAATAATTNLTCCTFTVPANTLVVGSTFILRGWFSFVHAAAAAPTLTAELLINAVVVATGILTPVATAATYGGSVEAVFTIRTVGAGGTALPQVLFSGANFGGAGSADGSAVTATVGFDTTVGRSLELRIRMTTGVASNTLTVTNGIVTRLL